MLHTGGRGVQGDAGGPLCDTYMWQGLSVTHNGKEIQYGGDTDSSVTFEGAPRNKWVKRGIL